LRLSGIKKELKKYKNALVPADTGEIILQIDGKPELPPETPGKKRIVLDMRMGWDEVEDATSLEEEVKTEVNALLSLGVPRKKIEAEFIRAEVNPVPFIPDSPALFPVSVQAEQEPEAEEEPGELSRLLGRNRR
jgi:hypothetical protein